MIEKKQGRRLTLLIAVFTIIYIFWSFGVFDMYAHLFSEKHLHRPNLIFRLGFVAVYSLANYFYFVPRFYLQNRYILFFSVALFCLIALLILPEFVIKQPKFDIPNLANGQPLPPLPHLPIPAPLFEVVNIIVLFAISTFSGIFLKMRQKLPFSPINEPDSTEIAPILEEKNDPSVIAPSETALTVTVNYALVRIEFSDILYIKSMDNYLHFYLKDKKPILVRMTMKEATSKLPSEAFLRVHKSYVVAIAAIESIRNKTILVAKQDIPIGRVYEENVFKVFEK